MTLRAPYNFVPLSQKVFSPEDWANQVSQDIPFSDGESGVIELEIQNISPLFIKDHKEGAFSAHINKEDGNRRYFIPGSSLRGCFRSVLEILSFSKIGLHNESSFGMQRVFDTQNSDGKAYKDAVNNVQCGWLVRNEDDSYSLYRCSEGIQTISHEDITEILGFSKFNAGQEHKTAEVKQRSLDVNNEFTYPILDLEDNEINDVPAGKYRLVCTGFFDKKKHEYLFSEKQEDPINIDQNDEVIKAFHSINLKSKYYYSVVPKTKEEEFCLHKRLKSGEPIPVFFTLKDGKIKDIGLTRQLRPAYTTNVQQAIANIHKVHLDNNQHDMAELIFGYINGKEELKSRITISHAFSDAEISDNKLISIQGVLGTPSASFYPLYLTQDNWGKYTTWNTQGAQIAGRKRYRIHKDNSNISLPKGNQNDNTQSYFNALPAGLKFKCRIYIHNLRKAEIGALITTITLNDTKGIYHNIGLAKGYGCGKFSCKTKLIGFKHNSEDYCLAFEDALTQDGCDITRYWNIFASIAAEHEEKDISVMNLEQYTEAKRNTNYSTLKENNVTFNRFLTSKKIEELDRERKKQEEEAAIQQQRRNELLKDIEFINKFIELKEWNKAIKSIEDVLNKVSTDSVEYKQLNEKLKFCKEKLTEIKDPLENQNYKQCLEGKTSVGNILGSTKKWLSFPMHSMGAQELEYLKEILKKFKKRDVEAKRKELEQILGQEKVQEIIGNLH